VLLGAQGRVDPDQPVADGPPQSGESGNTTPRLVAGSASEIEWAEVLPRAEPSRSCAIRRHCVGAADMQHPANARA
jgi:hypothetical protein